MMQVNWANVQIILPKQGQSKWSGEVLLYKYDAHTLSSVPSHAKFKLTAAVESMWWGEKAVVVHHCAVLLVSWQGPTVLPGMTWISIIYWNKPSYYLAFSSMQSCPLHIVQITGHRLNFRLQFPISTTLFPLHWTHNSCFDLWLSSQVSHVYFSQAFL